MADSDRDAAQRQRPDEDLEEDALEEDVDSADDDEEFEESIEDDIDDFDDEDSDVKSLDGNLPQRDQNARALAIRRAIEQRMEQKRLARDLDYLDLDLDDD